MLVKIVIDTYFEIKKSNAYTFQIMYNCFIWFSYLNIGKRYLKIKIIVSTIYIYLFIWNMSWFLFLLLFLFQEL